jgi:hypothetical protein
MHYRSFHSLLMTLFFFLPIFAQAGLSFDDSLAGRWMLESYNHPELNKELSFFETDLVKEFEGQMCKIYFIIDNSETYGKYLAGYLAKNVWGSNYHALALYTILSSGEWLKEGGGLITRIEGDSLILIGYPDNNKEIGRITRLQQFPPNPFMGGD